ncbi:hypothetical protein BS78_05G228700 [Paspalum vaginatum]|nr:hypothetical protein BS78_05G228700 [Paspalum vaginatum]
MASVRADKLKMTVAVAVCVVLVLLSMGPPTMADMVDDCRDRCRAECHGSVDEFCRNLGNSFPPLNLLYRTCKVRLSSECIHACIDICSLNTLTPPGSSPPPATCKQY